MQRDEQSNLHQPEKDGANSAVVISTVTPPPVFSVEIENPIAKPKDGYCDWCRKNRADIFCDLLPICFDCIELMIERENGIAINKIIAEAPLPAEWERKDA